MNLLSKLHKNSILTGPVENYCLACGCLLRNEEESYAHIHNQDHVDKLEALLRLENYKEDCIIKIKEGYYCPFCNIILPTIKRVSLHVTEPKHKDNKNSQSITRHAGVIFAFDVVINDRSWNGFKDSKCFVCNEDYDDEEEHKRAATHVYNLIQIKCEFGDNFIYRKVDEELFFCLICNNVYPIPEKQTHHESERHLELYVESKAKGISIRNNTASIDTKDGIGPNNNTISIPEKSVQITQNSTENKANIDNNKPKVNETVAQNGTAHIDDHKYSTITKIDQKKPNLNNPEVKLEKNTQDPAKFNTENTTPVLRRNTPNKSTQEAIKPNTAKVCEGNDRSKIKTARLNTENVQTPKGLKTQKKNSQETAKLNPEKTEELKDTLKTTLNTDSVRKNSEPKISEAVNIETDKINKVEELRFDNYLKACNYIVIGKNTTCLLCNINVKEADTFEHCLDKHHSLLYEKEVARQNDILSKNLKTVKEDSHNSPSKTIVFNSDEIDKENASPVIEKANKKTQNASSKNVKPTDIAPVDQPNKIQSKPQTENKEDSKLNKETAPDNKAQNGNTIQKSTNERNEGETKSKPIPVKKVTKKAQRKAAKAKTAEIVAAAKAKVSNENGTQNSTCGTGPSEIPLKENTTNAAVLSKLLVNNSKKNLDDVMMMNDVLENGEGASKELGIGEIMAAQFGTDADLKTDKLLNILKTVSQVDSSDDLVINSKYVLGNLSFVLVVRKELNAVCLACDQELTRDEIFTHVATEGHWRNVEDCRVVTSLDDEFIRQVKSKEYHCGYCNILMQSWDEMKQHLESYRHSDAKTSTRWRLQCYHPHLGHCQAREVRSVLTTLYSGLT